MIDEQQMRNAVRDRDSAYDDRFVYAVVTTGVYCRPSCAARPARPENLRFFESGEKAGAAGYRPCKRCRPEKPAHHLDALVKAARHLEARSDERVTLAELAAQAGLSPSRFQRAFKSVFGVTPKAYQDAVRLKRLKSSLRSGDDVSGAIYSAGFGSTSRVYGAPKRNIGMTPGTYRAGGAGETIACTCRHTVFGPLMLAATERGVCFAQFGDSAEQLRNQLAEEFPNAALVASPAEDSPELDAWLDALVAHVGEGAPRPELPLDLRGTAFQIKVWHFLLSIPQGDVMSYGEVAAGIGQPSAVRAVASACGANRVAVLVPCHRVLKGDGSIGGYRWGIPRKRALLDVERRNRTVTS